MGFRYRPRISTHTRKSDNTMFFSTLLSRPLKTSSLAWLKEWSTSYRRPRSSPTGNSKYLEALDPAKSQDRFMTDMCDHSTAHCQRAKGATPPTYLYNGSNYVVAGRGYGSDALSYYYDFHARGDYIKYEIR